MATVLKKQCMGVGRPTMLGNMEDIMMSLSIRV